MQTAKAVPASVISLEDYRLQHLIDNFNTNFKLMRHRSPQPVSALKLIGEAHHNRVETSLTLDKFLQESPKLLYQLLDILLSDFDYLNHKMSQTAVACRGIAVFINRLTEIWEVPNE